MDESQPLPLGKGHKEHTTKTSTKTYRVKNVFDKKSYPTKEATKVLSKVKKIIS